MRAPLVVCLACLSLVFACKSKDDAGKTPAIATKRAETDESPKGKSNMSLALALALDAGKLVVTEGGKNTEYPLACP